VSRSLLLHPPTQDELERMYHELAAKGAPAVGRKRPWPYDARGLEQLLVLAGEMLRHDARLLSILLELVLARWQSLDPQELRRQMTAMTSPQALLVVFEFARQASSEPELRYLVDYVAAGYRPVVPAQAFFLDAAVPGTRTHERRRGRSLTAYSKWGFLGTERPSTSATGKTRVGRYDAPTRRRIRHEIAAKRGAFTMRQYLAALDHGITRQRAYQDLHGDPDFELAGHGAGARWRLRGPATARARAGRGSRRRSRSANEA
jgi:hypothetical protein